MTEEQEPTAILVVLRPGTTEIEASALRTALRMWNHVVDVRPVSKDNRFAVAESRIRTEVLETMAPIFETMREEIGTVLSVATDSFEAIAADEPLIPEPTPLPEQRRSSG